MNPGQTITPTEPGDYEFKGIYACAIATGECNDWCQCKVVLSRYGLSVDFIDMPRPIGEQVPVTAFHGQWRKLDQPITPGEGWRLLRLGEIIQPGDEYFWRGHEHMGWNACTTVVGECAGIVDPDFAIRRRIEQPTPAVSALSACCNAPMQVNGSREGTNFYRCEKCEKPCDPATPSIEVCDAEDAKLSNSVSHAAINARVRKLEAALIRLRDCDWVITPRDRMDAVRAIAREALKSP